MLRTLSWRKFLSVRTHQRKGPERSVGESSFSRTCFITPEQLCVRVFIGSNVTTNQFRTGIPDHCKVAQVDHRILCVGSCQYIIPTAKYSILETKNKGRWSFSFVEESCSTLLFLWPNSTSTQHPSYFLPHSTFNTRTSAHQRRFCADMFGLMEENYLCRCELFLQFVRSIDWASTRLKPNGEGSLIWAESGAQLPGCSVGTFPQFRCFFTLGIHGRPGLLVPGSVPDVEQT